MIDTAVAGWRGRDALAAGGDEGDVRQIMIREQAVDAGACDDVRAHAAAHGAKATPARVASLDGKGEGRLDPEVRASDIIPVAGIERALNQLVADLLTSHVEPFFGAEVEWWEEPRLLRYREGGKYELHADADRWVERPGLGGRWERHLDRDVSILLYLNDGFTGGKLRFPAQGLEVAPSPGLVVAFPSSSAYRHGAEPTERGERLVLVSWAGLVGKPRVSGPPRNAIFKKAWRDRLGSG